VSQEELDAGLVVCGGQGLTGGQLMACATDVTLFNDTTLAEATAYQASCADGCQTHGSCFNGVCTCLPGTVGL
jgi:hypothetical protein